MFKDLYWLSILLIFAIIFYYSNKNPNQYLISEGFKDSPVYLIDNPIKTNDIINMNNIPFASTSIYEIGKIDYPSSDYKGYYQNYYPQYYPGYYSGYI